MYSLVTGCPCFQDQEAVSDTGSLVGGRGKEGRQQRGQGTPETGAPPETGALTGPTASGAGLWEGPLAQQPGWGVKCVPTPGPVMGSQQRWPAEMQSDWGAAALTCSGSCCKKDPEGRCRAVGTGLERTPP